MRASVAAESPTDLAEYSHPSLVARVGMPAASCEN
jgi:hypothetical protein